MIRATVHRAGQSEPVAVDVEVGEGAIVARAGEERWDVPLREATLEPGGFDADFVFCRPPDASFTLAVRDPRFVEALEARADERMRGELAKVRAHRTRHRRGRWIGVGAAAAIVALGVAAVLSVPRLLASSVDALPASVDRQLGDAAIGELELAGPSVDAPAVRAFLDEVVGRLEPHAAVSGFEFRVRVVQSDQVNAFALPGGQMVVFTGLLRRADGPEQVAGVLAHEMAHVTLRHGLRNLAHRAGLVLAIQLLLGDAAGWLELAADAAALAQSNDYSREQESAADAEGVRMLLAAGLDPHGLAGFFRLLQGEPGSELAGAMSWLSTHPAHEERIAHVNALARELPAGPRRPLASDFGAVQAALR